MFSHPANSATGVLSWHSEPNGFVLHGLEHVQVSSLVRTASVPHPVFMVRQIHGAHIVVAEESSAYCPGDGIITRRGIGIGVATADCCPLVILTPDPLCYGVFHVGWRGLQKGMVENAIAAFLHMGLLSESLTAILGPAICGTCYEVGQEFESWARGFLHKSARADKHLLDIPGFVRHKLDNSHLAVVTMPPACTYESAGLPSYRREGDRCGRIITMACTLPRQ